MLRKMTLFSVLLAAGCATTGGAAPNATSIAALGLKVALCVEDAWQSYHSTTVEQALYAPSPTTTTVVVPVQAAPPLAAQPEPGK